MSLYLTHYSHRKKRTGQAQYDLNADTNTLTDSQHGADMCVHIDTQSQDGDSLVNEDAPVVEKFELREREMETSTELAKQLDHQESSHSSVDQKQDLHVPCLNSPVIVNDSQQPPLPDTQGATGLQEASDDTSAAEEVELKVLGDDQNDQARTSGDQRQDLSLVHTPVTFSDSQQPPLPDSQGATGLQEASDDTSAAEEVELKVLGDDQNDQARTSGDQRQDLSLVHTPVTFSDSQQPPLPDTQGATGLQEASDDTSAAEEVELRVLGDDQNDQARTSGDQRQESQDLSLVHTPVTFSDSQQPPLPDTQGATGLQETSDDTSAAEEVELKVLGDDEEEEQASSDKDATLHCTRASGDHGDTGEQVEMSEMHNLETEKHKPFEYQKL